MKLELVLTGVIVEEAIEIRLTTRKRSAVVIGSEQPDLTPSATRQFPERLDGSRRRSIIATIRSKSLSSKTMRAGTKASSGSSRLAAIRKRSACSTTKFFFSPWLFSEPIQLLLGGGRDCGWDLRVRAHACFTMENLGWLYRTYPMGRLMPTVIF